MPAKTCQYGNCLEDVGADGVVVSLKTATYIDEEKRAVYCCAGHAAAALRRLAIDRKETSEHQAKTWVIYSKGINQTLTPKLANAVENDINNAGVRFGDLTPDFP